MTREAEKPYNIGCSAPPIRDSGGQNHTVLAAFFVSMEYKKLPQFTKAIDGRTVTGIFAVHGNVDSGGDVSLNGAFAKQLSTGRKRTRFLWNHNGMNPPIASIRSVREVDRSGLPPKVLEFAPDATGGVEVVREYYEKVDLADWVLAGITQGDIDEMSYAYDVLDFGYEERNGGQVRVLKELELYDISDVNWGMNPATAGVKGILGFGLPFAEHSEAVVAAVKEFLDRAQDRREFRAKEGRVLSGANRTRISDLMSSMTTLAGELAALLAETEPKADPTVINGLYAQFLRLDAKLRGETHHA